MKENPTPFLDGANALEDIVEYSEDRHKVIFGLCDFDVFLEEYSIDDSVEIMFVSESKFSNLTFLGQLPNLREFYIDYPFENFVSLVDLKACYKLEKLVAVNCHIKKIEGLEDLEHLESVTLFINEIPKIEGLETLTGLKELDLSSNQIEKIEGLDNLLALESLNLSANKIRKIEDLENLINLKSLRLRQNHIRVIEGLNNLKKLEFLHLGANYLFQGAVFVLKQDLEKYISDLPSLKKFNNYKFPLSEKIYLDPSSDCQ